MLAVGSIAVSEMLYPALSFYYFHALLCWLVVFWRILKADKRSREVVYPGASETTPSLSRTINTTTDVMEYVV